MSESEKSKESPKRLSDEQWQAAKIKWRSGNYTLEQLSEEFKVSPQALQRRFKRNDVIKGEDKMAYEEKIREAELRARADVARKEEKAMREKADGLKKFILSAVEITGKKLMAEMAKNRDAPLEALQESAKAAKEITLVMKNSADIVEKIVPSEEVDPDDLPELYVSELTKDDIEEIKRAQLEEELDILGNGELNPEQFGLDENVVVEGDEPAEDSPESE